MIKDETGSAEKSASVVSVTVTVVSIAVNVVSGASVVVKEAAAVSGETVFASVTVVVSSAASVSTTVVSDREVSDSETAAVSGTVSSVSSAAVCVRAIVPEGTGSFREPSSPQAARVTASAQKIAEITYLFDLNVIQSLSLFLLVAS